MDQQQGGAPVASHFGPTPGVPDAEAPHWTRGSIEPPAGEKDMGTYVAGVYTEEQQARLGVNMWGEKVLIVKLNSDATSNSNTLKTLGPAWTRGEQEPPKGSKSMGSYTVAVYTDEQQQRLGVDESGNPSSSSTGFVQAVGPAWTRGELEPPQGTRSMGDWTAAVYTEEQQHRLGVDEFGETKSTISCPFAKAPQWTKGKLEPPAGKRDMGSWCAAVYTDEQQHRLGVTEFGKKIQSKVSNSKMVGGTDLRPDWLKGGVEKPLGLKDMGTWKKAVYTEEQMTRLGVNEDGKPL